MAVTEVLLRRARLRLGALSGVLGALLALVVNPLHGDLPADPEMALTRVATSDSWGLLHLGIIVSVVLIVGGLFGFSEIAEAPLARAFAQLAVVMALPGAAVLIVGIAIDGFATKALADVWWSATATERAAAFRIAVATEEIQNALFHMWAALFIGLPFLLMGISGALAGGGFPRWLGLLASIGGAGAVFMGVAGFLHVPVPSLLFNVFALLVTLWALIAGVLVWRAPACSAIRSAPAARA